MYNKPEYCFTNAWSKISLNHNKELAAIFRQMSDCYKYMGPEQRFRALAYETVSKTLSNMQQPIDILAPDIKKLDELKGVGDSIAEKLLNTCKPGKSEHLKN